MCQIHIRRWCLFARVPLRFTVACTHGNVSITTRRGTCHAIGTVFVLVNPAIVGAHVPVIRAATSPAAELSYRAFRVGALVAFETVEPRKHWSGYGLLPLANNTTARPCAVLVGSAPDVTACIAHAWVGTEQVLVGLTDDVWD